jgi:hypothetical protein
MSDSQPSSSKHPRPLVARVRSALLYTLVGFSLAALTAVTATAAKSWRDGRAARSRALYEEGLVLVGSGHATEALEGAVTGQTLADLLVDQPLPMVHPDQSLDTALRVLGPHPMLVVSRRSDGRLLGAIGIDEVLAAYGVAGRPACGAGVESHA